METAIAEPDAPTPNTPIRRRARGVTILTHRLRARRLALGLSLEELGRGVCTRNHVSLIENGKSRPSPHTLQVFAERLGLPIEYFTNEDVPEEVTEPGLAALSDQTSQLSRAIEERSRVAREVDRELLVLIAGLLRWAARALGRISNRTTTSPSSGRPAGPGAPPAD